MSPVSADTPDWSREAVAGWDPARRLLRSVRDYQKARTGIGRKWAVLRHRFWPAVSGAELPLTLRAGGGLMLPHPNGVVVHPDVRIGPNCMVFQQVTLGANRGVDGVPTLGGHVDIGPGARVLGPVTIGDHAAIGANAVVLRDVPAGAVAVGVPARILPAKQINASAQAGANKEKET